MLLITDVKVFIGELLVTLFSAWHTDLPPKYVAVFSTAVFTINGKNSSKQYNLCQISIFLKQIFSKKPLASGMN